MDFIFTIFVFVSLEKEERFKCNKSLHTYQKKKLRLDVSKKCSIDDHCRKSLIKLAGAENIEEMQLFQMKLVPFKSFDVKGFDCLFHTQKFNVKGKGGISWNNARVTPSTISKIWRANELCTLSNR